MPEAQRGSAGGQSRCRRPPAQPGTEEAQGNDAGYYAFFANYLDVAGIPVRVTMRDPTPCVRLRPIPCVVPLEKLSSSLCTVQISPGKTHDVRGMNARFTKCIPLQMEDFAVTCPLVPDASRLISSSCSSSHRFSFRFFQTPPRDDALAVCLSFGSAITWNGDSHPTRHGPCPAHTPELSRATKWLRLE